MQNADNIAALFNEINPFFQEDEVRQFMYGHIDRIKRILSNRLASNYAAEMDAFDEAREQVIMMSDYFTNGIIEQFPNQFL